MSLQSEFSGTLILTAYPEARQPVLAWWGFGLPAPPIDLLNKGALGDQAQIHTFGSIAPGIAQSHSLAWYGAAESGKIRQSATTDCTERCPGNNEGDTVSCRTPL